MTCEVIDTLPPLRFAEDMTQPVRFDRTVRTVMWLDAFLSVAFVVVGIVASPVVASVGVPPPITFAVAAAAIVCAILLAAFGAITAVLLMLRMRGGQFFLPEHLRLPLPPGMRPRLVTYSASTSSSSASRNPTRR